MRHKCIVMPLLAAFCILAACTRKAPGEDGNPVPPVKTDSSKCLLTNVNYPSGVNMPYDRDPVIFTYDSLRQILSSRSANGGFFTQYSYEQDRIILHSYINSTSAIDSNLVDIRIYRLDNNNRVVNSSRRWYIKPDSEDDYLGRDSIDYQYDAEGFLTNERMYSSGNRLNEEYKYIYQNGNMLQKEHIYYNFVGEPGVKRGADTLTYTYDNTTWYSEAAYLYELSGNMDIRFGKPNKNNVIGIQCKMHDFSGTNSNNLFETIGYTYTEKGGRLVKVTMHATTNKGFDINSNIDFGYKCD